MKRILFLVFLVFAHPAHSRLYFDGHAGFGFTLDQDSDEDYPQFSGPEAGARLGIAYGPLIFGADAAYGLYNAEVASSSGSYQMTKLDLGVFAGLEFLKLLRVWGSYYIATEMDFDSPDSYNLKGTAAGGGVGITILPLVSVNVEAKYYNMNKITTSGSTTTLTGDDKFRPLEILVSIGVIF